MAKMQIGRECFYLRQRICKQQGEMKTDREIMNWN